MLAIILSTVFANDLSIGNRFRRSNANEATRIEKLNRTLAYFDGRNRLVDEKIARTMLASQERMALLQSMKAKNDEEISRVRALRDQLVGNNIARAENVVTRNVAEELTQTPSAIVEAPTAFTAAADAALPFPQEAAAPPVIPQEVAPAVMTELPVEMPAVVTQPSAETSPTLGVTPAEVPAPSIPETATPAPVLDTTPAAEASVTNALETAAPATTDVTTSTETPQTEQGAPVVTPKTLDEGQTAPAVVAVP
jgi:hypothetical protein